MIYVQPISHLFKTQELLILISFGY